MRHKFLSPSRHCGFTPRHCGFTPCHCGFTPRHCGLNGSAMTQGEILKGVYLSAFVFNLLHLL